MSYHERLLEVYVTNVCLYQIKSNQMLFKVSNVHLKENIN